MTEELDESIKGKNLGNRGDGAMGTPVSGPRVSVDETRGRYETDERYKERLARERQEKKEWDAEQQKRTFSVNLSGMKDVVGKQVADQVIDSGLRSALQAIVTAAPGNAVSLSGTMESSEDGTKGKLTITGIFKTVSDEDIKATEDRRKEEEKARARPRRGDALTSEQEATAAGMRGDLAKLTRDEDAARPAKR